MMKVLANDGISKAGADRLKEAGITLFDQRVSPEHLINFINENKVDVLLVRSATKVKKELIDACKSLKIIGRGGVGMDNIDVDYAREKGLILINTPTASTRSVAEIVFAHFLSLARHLHEANRLMPLEGDTKFDQLKRSFANAYELQGKALGVIGFGNIGKEVAKIGIAMGMKVKVFTRTSRQETIELNFFDGQKLSFNIQTTNNWDEFLSDTEFLSINTPKTNGYLIDEEQLQKMKHGVYIVNTARGGVINEKALMNFIEEGKVAGAALDVFENEPHPEIQVLMNPALSLTPHLGGSTIDAQEKIGIELANQIIDIKTKL